MLAWIHSRRSDIDQRQFNIDTGALARMAPARPHLAGHGITSATTDRQTRLQAYWRHADLRPQQQQQQQRSYRRRSLYRDAHTILGRGASHTCLPRKSYDILSSDVRRPLNLRRFKVVLRRQTNLISRRRVGCCRVESDGTRQRDVVCRRIYDLKSP